MNVLKIVLKVVIGIVILAVAVVGGYVIYVVSNYERIPDNEDLYVQEGGLTSDRVDNLVAGEEYDMLTFNIGFGAYNHDFSFFMDEGYMADGSETVGAMSRAASEKSVDEATDVIVEQTLAEKPDIALFQEVDVDADRSHNVNQVLPVLGGLGLYNGLNWTYGTNFHTSYLFYPPTKPIGYIKDSGLLTVSNYKIDSAVRRSYPVSDAFPTKFFDLDRCFVVNRLPVENAAGESKTLVLINTHMSAYDEGGTIRKAQMEMLTGLMAEEYEKGNYVIVGGDFNHALAGTEDSNLNGMKRPDWVQPFDEKMLPDGFTMLTADNADEVMTDRDSSITYEKGVNYEVTLDGFMVSDNVKATSHNVDGDFLGSDHNPVRMTFTLQ